MQRYFCTLKKNNNFILEDSDIHHIKHVMRMNKNDKIEVVYEQKTYLCKIDSIDNFSISITSEIEENNELNVELVLAIGLVNEQKFDLILEKATELGVSTIIPLKLARSIVKIDQSKLSKKYERWQNICKEASEQSKRNIVPNVAQIMTIKDLVKLNANTKILLSTRETKKRLNSSLLSSSNCDKIIIVVGVEGGVTEEEEIFLNEHDYASISLGNRIMRVETAAIYITSVINYIYMR